MSGGFGSAKEKRLGRAPIPEVAFCEEKNRLMVEFLDAIRKLTTLQSQQSQAVIEGDPDFGQFDLLLHLAQEKKDKAKYEWIAHVESHHCEEG
jgi:hypothetical protein